MKILVLGSGGRLAPALARGWKNGHEVVSLGRADLDVSDPQSLERALALHEFEWLVNGTGLTNVDRCESARDEARQVNAVAPGIMAAAARRRGARLVHFSTDYVFDGMSGRPCREEDPARPLGWYGETKLAGEQAVLSDSSAHLVVRVSWVFGPDKPGFVDVILERARTEARVGAVADKFSSPTFSLDVAGWIEPFFHSVQPGGLFHAANAGACSWREYGAFALECAARAGVPLATTEVAPLRLADMKQFLAPRPVYTVLSTAKLTATTGITPRPWQEAVRQFILEKYAPIPPST